MNISADLYGRARAGRGLGLALLGCLVLTGCTFGSPSPQSRVDAATVAACRRQADQIYEEQNRGAIYSSESQVNTPSSGSYQPGITNRGLGERYVREKMISNCVRNTGTTTDRGATRGLSATP